MIHFPLSVLLTRLHLLLLGHSFRPSLVMVLPLRMHGGASAHDIRRLAKPSFCSFGHSHALPQITFLSWIIIVLAVFIVFCAIHAKKDRIPTGLKAGRQVCRATRWIPPTESSHLVFLLFLAVRPSALLPSLTALRALLLEDSELGFVSQLACVPLKCEDVSRCCPQSLCGQLTHSLVSTGICPSSSPSNQCPLLSTMDTAVTRRK